MSNEEHKLNPEQSILEELVQRLSGMAGIVRIILFGSAAQGRMGPDSDLDLLVIVKDGLHRRRTAQSIYKRLSGLGTSKDIVVVTESDVRKYKDNPSLVIFPALASGKELYHAAG